MMLATQVSIQTRLDIWYKRQNHTKRRDVILLLKTEREIDREKNEIDKGKAGMGGGETEKGDRER